MIIEDVFLLLFQKKTANHNRKVTKTNIVIDDKWILWLLVSIALLQNDNRDNQVFFLCLFVYNIDVTQ